MRNLLAANRLLLVDTISMKNSTIAMQDIVVFNLG